MKYLFIALFFFCMECTASAQDLNFSQFYELPLLRNPALAGVFNGDVRLQSVYRNQWQSVTVPFRTGALSAEIKLPSCGNYSYVTLGLQTIYDVAGDSKLSRLQVLPVVCYQQNLNGEGGAHISGAFMGGNVRSQFDPTGLKWDDQFVNGQYSPTNPTRQVLNSTGKNYWDLSGGLALTSPLEFGSFYVGLALFHFNSPDVGFHVAADSASKLDRKIVLNGGLSIENTESSRITIFTDYFSQGGHRQFVGGLFYSIDVVDYLQDPYDNYEDKTKVTFGGLYRWNDAFIPTVRLEHHKFSMGLSYDVNVSKLKTASQARGGLELTLNYVSPISGRNCASAKMKCPRL